MSMAPRVCEPSRSISPPPHLPTPPAQMNRMQDKHDSIEDARVALQLYRAYLDLKANGKLQETINHLYDVGRDTNWSVP